MLPSLLPSLYSLNLLLHVVFGLGCIAAVVTPLLSRKGGRLHRRAGWVFVAALTGTALTGSFIALTWIVAPLAVKPFDAPPERLQQIAATLRTLGWFFALVAWMAFGAAWSGVSALRSAKRPSPWWARVDLGVILATMTGGAALLALGARASSALLVAFGLIGLVTGALDLRRVGRTDRASRLIRHLESMLGGFTVVITAFAVLVGRRYGGELFQVAQLWYWLVPVGFGMLLSELWKRRVQRRYARG